MARATPPGWRERPGSPTWLAGAALLLAVVAVVLLLFGPVSSTESVELRVDPRSGEEREVRRHGSQTLLEREGASVLAVLAVPLVLTGLGVFAVQRARRQLLAGVAIAYAAGVVLAIASVGLLFVPSLAALVLAHRRLEPPPVDRARRG